MFLNFLPQSNNQRGFTLIELMVSIAIIVIITAVVLVQYSSFNSSVLLSSQAYRTAFDLRETQSLAISVRGQGISGGSNQFTHAYGVYFDIANNSQYIVFLDNNDNNAYDVGEQIGKALYLDPRFNISELCTQGSSGKKCANSNGNNNDFVSILFKRPDFDAFYDDKSNNSNITKAEITFSPISNTGVTRTVVVTSTGQISVQ